MSRFRFAVALPVILGASPLLAQGYYYPQPAPPPQAYYGYNQAPAPQGYPQNYPPQGRYQQDPRGYPPQQGYYPQQQPQPRYPEQDQGGYQRPQARQEQPDPQPPLEDADRLPPRQARIAASDGGPTLPPPAQPAVDRLEQMLWQAAAQANSLSGYRTYLGRYPNGEHAGQAMASIEQIRRNPPTEHPAPVAEAAPAVAVAAPVKAVETAAAPIAVASAAVEAPVKSLMQVKAGARPLPTVTVPTAAVPVAPNEVAEASAAVAVAAANAVAPKPAAPITVAQAEMPARVIPAVATTAPVADASPMVCHPAYASEAPYEQAGEAEIGAYLVAVRMNSVGAYEGYLHAYPHGVFAPEVSDLVASRQGRIGALSKVSAAGPASARSRGQVMPSEGDYPTMALRDGQEGKATAIWEVAEDGCVEACRIDRSSGSAALDAATCRMITTKGRYDPALDAQGHPVRSVDSATFTWKLPVH